MRAFSALVQAMDAKDVVGIARRVYNKNGSPFVGALFPHITPDFQVRFCLYNGNNQTFEVS